MATGMFQWLGEALGLLRRLRRKSQARVAREAGIGKSQLSKYELGRELPKLDTLERVLRSLGVSHLELACTLALIQDRAERLAAAEAGGTAGDFALLLLDHDGLSGTEGIFGGVFTELLKLHQGVAELLLFSPAGPGPSGGSGARR